MSFGSYPEVWRKCSATPAAPALTTESVERGKQSYAELGCAKCHGELGRTDGATAPTLKDDA